MTSHQEKPKGLADALSRPFYACNFMQTVATLDAAEQQAVQAAVEKIRIAATEKSWRRNGYTVTWLHRILTENGLNVTPRQVDWHVKNRCLCES